MTKALKPGDWVVYRKSKQGPAPGPRAQHVTAAPKGDDYAYVVDKYWIVEDVASDQTVLLRTRRGKIHRVSLEDPALRKAGPIVRLLCRQRFLDVDQNRDAGRSAAMST